MGVDFLVTTRLPETLLMQKFLLLYREGMPTSEPSPEQMQKIMAEWTEWIGEGAKSGVLAQVGDSLGYEGCVYRSGGVRTDGPFMENKEVCGGYSVAQGESIEAIEDYVKRCPSCTSGGSVEVRPLNGVGDLMK